MKIALWVMGICVGVPFILMSILFTITSWKYCHEKSFFYNIRYVYKHYDFTELDIAPITRGTEECPKSPEEIEGENSLPQGFPLR